MKHNSKRSQSQVKSEGDHWGDDDVPTVSEVIGEGTDAHRIVRVGAWEFVASAADSEPRIRDIDLAGRLGYERPRKVRDLIRRLAAEEKLNDLHHRPAVGRVPGQVAARPEREYWLTEAQALKVVAKSETAKADAILDEVIRVFVLARKGLLPQQQAMTFDPQTFVQAIAPILAQTAANAATTAVTTALAPVMARLAAVEKRVEDGVSVSGVISQAQANNIKSRLRIIGDKLFECGHEKKVRSARLKAEGRLRTAIGWMGRGCYWHLLPLHSEGEALRELAAMEHEANGVYKALMAKRQGDLFEPDPKKAN